MQSATRPFRELGNLYAGKPTFWASEASEWGGLARSGPTLEGGRPCAQEGSHNPVSVDGCAGSNYSKKGWDPDQSDQPQHLVRCVRLQRTRREQVFFGVLAGGETDSNAECHLPFLCDGVHEVFQERAQKHHGDCSDAGILFRHGGSLGLPPGARAGMEEAQRKKRFPERNAMEGGAPKTGLRGSVCDLVRDDSLSPRGAGADDEEKLDDLAGEIDLPEQTLRESVRTRFEDGSVGGGGSLVHSCSDYIGSNASNVDASFVLRREMFELGGGMARDRFSGEDLVRSRDDELNCDPGHEKISGKGFARGQPSKPFGGFAEICRLGFCANALLEAMRHTYLTITGKPSGNSEFLRQMVCSGWFKNVCPLRQTVRSGKRSCVRNDVNKETSKTNGLSVSQDKVRMDVTKGNGLAAEDSTKEIDGKVGRDAGKTKETVEVTIAGKTVPHRPMETDPLTGLSLIHI